MVCPSVKAGACAADVEFIYKSRLHWGDVILMKCDQNISNMRSASFQKQEQDIYSSFIVGYLDASNNNGDSNRIWAHGSMPGQVP
ncbi:hypothetical protein M8J77_024576 [Diaphorina citri]|nr:hypothetical protein M8J77_024576 [Diaphorina citri]